MKFKIPKSESGIYVAIACSATKLNQSAMVRHFYTGALFRKSVQWAEENHLPWFVLSSKHGAMWPDRRIAPYHHTISTCTRTRKNSGANSTTATAAEREEWNLKTRRQLSKMIGLGATIIALVPNDYVKGLQDWHTIRPMAGLGLGERLQWLNQQL